MQEKPKHIDGLDIEQTEDGYIIYEADKDRVHYLNPTAALILELCNGSNSIDAISELVQEAFHLPEAPEQVVRETITQMTGEGLLL